MKCSEKERMTDNRNSLKREIDMAGDIYEKVCGIEKDESCYKILNNDIYTFYFGLKSKSYCQIHSKSGK